MSAGGAAAPAAHEALLSSLGSSRARTAAQLALRQLASTPQGHSANDDDRAAGVVLFQLHGHASIDGRRPGAMSARTQRAQPTAAGGAHRRRGEGCSDEVKPGLLGGGRAAYRGHAGRSAADGSCMAASRSGAASKCGLAEPRTASNEVWVLWWVFYRRRQERVVSALTAEGRGLTPPSPQLAQKIRGPGGPGLGVQVNRWRRSALPDSSTSPRPGCSDTLRRSHP